MPRKKNPEEVDPRSATPAREDQSEILDEAGAELDDDSGEHFVSEERVRDLGAVDTESVRDNRRMKEVVNKKRGGVKGVVFNTDDLLAKYEVLIAEWPPNTIDISVRRLTGTPVQHVILSRPRSGAELYEALRAQVHKEYEEAAYEVRFIDSSKKSWRGSGRITLPDTRGPTQQQGQPMHYPPLGYPGYPPGYPPPPPGYPPPLSGGYQPPPPAPSPPTPPVAAAAAAPVAAPYGQPPQTDMSQMLGTFQQLFEMSRQMQPPTPAPAPPAPPPMMMPPLPPSSDPGAQMAWMQQAFELFQRMQPQPQPPLPPVHSAAPQPPTPNPMYAVPPVQPPPGTMFVPGFGYVAVERLMAAIGPAAEGRPPPRQRAPYNPQGGPPSYEDESYRYSPRGYAPDRSNAGYAPGGYDPPRGYPRGGDPRGYDPRNDPRSGGYGPPPPAAPPRTAADEFRDQVSVVQTAVKSLREIEALLPNRRNDEGYDFTPEPVVDDSPLQVVEAGPAKIVINREDGSLRGVESMWANVPSIMKWAGEQFETIRKANAERQAPPRQQLPPNYVEVTPGYQPPAGFIAVPVDGYERHLPPPPARTPPPIRAQPQPQPQESWGAPPPQAWGDPEPEQEQEQEEG